MCPKTSSSLRKIAAPSTASRSLPSIRATKKSLISRPASMAVSPAKRSMIPWTRASSSRPVSLLQKKKPLTSRRLVSRSSRSAPCSLAKASAAAARSATASTSPRTKWRRSAKPSASLPLSPLASPERSSPCVPSTWVVLLRPPSSSPSSTSKTLVPSSTPTCVR